MFRLANENAMGARALPWVVSLFRRAAVGAALLLAIAAGSPPTTWAQEPGSGDAQWIWSPDYPKDRAPEGMCLFRKVFNCRDPERAQIEITCDDRYELFINGRQVGAGRNWKVLDVYDVRALLSSGKNVVAVRTYNAAPGSAGLVARLVVRNRGNTDVAFSTDDTWLTSTTEAENWESLRFDDSGWKPALVLGEFGRAAPWGDQVRAAGDVNPGRFRVQPGFRVERVASPDATGSLVAFAFDEQGDIIASRENGPLLRLSDTNGDGVRDTVATYSDEVTNCQGILPLNGQVFAVGEGPEGTGFYRIADQDRDGVGDSVTLLLKFRGRMAEHGPHAPVLGPDGLIYLVLGNHTATEDDADPASPHRHYYEGDLVQPRYEDAGGHAHGIKSPGGTVVRTDVDGSFVELYAGGFRNAYDIAFNRQGDLFTFDSDMEWDEGLPWYRPTRINHVTAGAEFGWRSGWSKWPDYYLDSLPAILDVGRGSPTGVEVYDHYQYPVRYHNALFLGDWSLGRIIVVRMKPEAGTYVARGDDFLLGRPLNVTDLAVGLDGWLYFSTGGRSTEGGMYRIVYEGKVPPRPEPKGIFRAIYQPQLNSAWGRNEIAKTRREMGDQWAVQLHAIADNPKQSAADRARALDLMQLVGPFPSTALLVKLSRDAQPEVRAKAAYLMGIHVDDATSARLVELLGDADPTVRRKACESLVRSGTAAPAATLIGLLDDRSRFVAWAARCALESLPRDQWESAVIASDNQRIFLDGAAALLALDPGRSTVDAILARVERMLTLPPESVPDAEFLDLLRITQLALIRGEISGDEIPGLRERLANEYPALEPRMNRELLRLLAYLDASATLPRVFEELADENNAVEDRLHAAFHLRFFPSGWTTDRRIELLEFYEYAGTLPGGHSFSRYVDNFRRDFVGQLEPADHAALLARGARIPSAALLVLPDLPEQLSAAQLAQLEELDQQLADRDDEASSKLMTGIIAVLARDGSPAAMAYLRDIYLNQPERRRDAAMGLAQAPGGDNWPLLVQSLAFVEHAAAQEVLMKLGTVDQVPDDPQALRNAILSGLKLGKDSGPALALLERWTGQRIAAEGDEWKVALGAWQQWFAENYPQLPAAELPVEPEGTRWTFQELSDYLHGTSASQGDAGRGALVFEKAQCIKCHRYGTRGEGVGPDLTTVSQRFQKREILESIVFPSHVVSDQYAAKIVVTTDGRTFTGIVGESGSDAILVLDSNGEKHVVAKDLIDEIAPTSKSSMPEGLLDPLTLEEIADLFAYLGQPPHGAQMTRRD